MKASIIENSKGFKNIVGKLTNDSLRITTNSRNTDGFNCFLAMKGERVDSHKFIGDVLDAGITNVIVDHDYKYESLLESYPQLCLILVEDSILYLREIAKNWFSLWKSNGGISLALSGSNGKTTTKEMLRDIASGVLGSEFVASTQGNFNNEIGVPLTILQEVSERTKFDIIEMGISHPGDMEVLCEIARPDYGFINNIGTAHIEFLKNREGVFEEKLGIYRSVKKTGIKFYVNTDDDLLNTLSGKEKTTDIIKSEILNPNILETYNLENLQCAAFIIGDLFSREEEVLMLAKEFKMPNMNRSQWMKINETEIFLDAYNANPDSMLAAIDSFVKNKSSHDALFVLGDMNELGELTEAEHSRVAKKLNELNISDAVFIGRYAKYYDSIFSGNSKCYESTDQYKNEFKKVLDSYKFIFLKASRSLQLESLIDITEDYTII